MALPPAPFATRGHLADECRPPHDARATGSKGESPTSVPTCLQESPLGQSHTCSPRLRWQIWPPASASESASLGLQCSNLPSIGGEVEPVWDRLLASRNQPRTK